MADQDPSSQASTTWLEGKTLEELHAIEAGGRTLFPDAFRQLDSKGVEKLTPVLVTPPTQMLRAQARLDAVALVREMNKGAACATVADAQALVGADVFEDLDTCAIVARCCYEPGSPDTPAYLLRILLQSFPPTTIIDMLDRITFYASLLDPRRPAPLTDAEVVAVAKAVKRAGNLTPLLAIAVEQQRDFMLSAVCLLADSRTPPSSSTSSGTSTPAS